MSLREHETVGSGLMSLMVRRSPYLAIWRAKVTALDRAFFQVPEDCCCCDSAGICDNHATFSAHKRRRPSVFAAAGKEFFAENSVHNAARTVAAASSESSLAAMETKPSPTVGRRQ